MNCITIQLGDSKKDFTLNEKKFRTGSRGYNGYGKMEVGDKKFQVSVNVVEIGSKSKKE